MAVLVIGTCHEYQRHQDANAGRERVRNDFEQVIRAAIAERAISLIAEEAGKKDEVHARLKADEAKTSAFDVLFADARVTDEPQDTIAKLVADELLGGNHIDVRPPNAEKMTVAERDKAMAAKTMESLGSATSVLVICGERHRAGVTAHLTNYGLRGESQPIGAASIRRWRCVVFAVKQTNSRVCTLIPRGNWRRSRLRLRASF